MLTHKISISVPQQQYDFLELYQSEHHCKSRSEVITRALKMLQQAQLEAAYREASEEVDNDFDITLLDGLDEDETW